MEEDNQFFFLIYNAMKQLIIKFVDMYMEIR